MKRSYYFALIWIIVAAAYLLFVFTYSVMPYTTVVWISIAFTLFAYGMAFFLMYLVFGKKLSFTKRFLGLPLHMVGVVYAAIQTVVGFVFISSSFSSRSAFVFQAILLGSCMLVVLVTQFLRNNIEHIDQDIKQKRMYLQELERKVAVIQSRTQNIEVKRNIKTIYDKLKYGPPMSPDRAGKLEHEISEKINLLDKIAASNEHEKVIRLCLEINRLLDERQSICRK